MKKCIECKTELTGRQRKYCSNKCKSNYHKKSYLSSKEGYKVILNSLTKGKEDFEIGITDNNIQGLNKYSWRINTSNGYVMSGIEYGSVSLHRVIWEFFNGPLLKGQQIDHINRIRTDNRLCNLRACSRGQNAANMSVKKNKKNSKYKGVQRTASGKYQACIWFNKKNHIIGGSYETEEEAALVYNKKAKELQGEFAYENIIKKSK